KHDTIGIDLVAMCANDIVVLGAEPLFFLDYYATGKLNTMSAADVIKGIGAGCELAGAALIGGETAEMPGMYHGEDYDLAGFCVGIVDKDKIIDGSQVSEGDTVLGMASSGVHSNGFSLVRRILETKGHKLNDRFENGTLGEALLEPTRIYVKSLLPLMQSGQIKAAAHITGGGLTENLPRVLPDYHCAQIESAGWQWPALFQWLQKEGNVQSTEMYRTFNCGIGMALVVTADNVESVRQQLEAAGETVYQLGSIAKQDEQDPKVVIR
ncbi:MAG: phosphoribosylformylglycinamidine cyclo-ligase, partial [Gammaproteobacteria bacterium]|nr:phosphoribosylformylglycinamidine cyclo-ligase [Gammaproteobacteria bacterium]